MDNKTFVAKFVADESERINQSLKDLLSSGETPSDAAKDAVFADMEATLAKLKGALEYLTANVDSMTFDEEHEEQPVA